MFGFLQFLCQREDINDAEPGRPISVRRYGMWDRNEGLRDVTRVVLRLPDPVPGQIKVTINGRRI